MIALAIIGLVAFVVVVVCLNREASRPCQSAEDREWQLFIAAHPELWEVTS